ncbi:MAG: ABC transporter substrate-binding protein, partial [Bacteroidales bacterium]|nr:ABC transporter substrate-binding protein [Bacteroidales bacterium]
MENHPLSRSEYVKLFGYLTGSEEEAEKDFSEVQRRYMDLRYSVAEGPKKKVLLNIPYADQWYVPGGDNYMSVLIRDAGGEVLGAVPG